MDGILIVGHGSRQPEPTRTLVELTRMLDGRPGRIVRCASLQFSRPSVDEALAAMVSDGIRRILVVPFFLWRGQHVSEDIPALIAAERAKYPGVEIRLAAHLGTDGRLADIVLDRVEEALPDGNGHRPGGPAEIEAESRRLIDARLPELARLSHEEREISRRVIHAAGDLGMSRLLRFGSGSVKAGVAALRAGAPIVTDVAMVKAGIRDRELIWGNRLVCGLETIAEISGPGETRSAAGIRQAVKANRGAIVAIGNAPTALFELISRFSSGEASVSLVVGCPVGFVGASQAKEELAAGGLPFVTIRGTRGGSAMAAAIVNGLIYLAGEDEVGR